MANEYTAGFNYPAFPALSSISGKITLAQMPTLTSTYLYVGGSSNVATAVAMSGDGSISNTGALTVASIGGKAVTLANTLTTTGNFTLTLTTTATTVSTLPAGTHTLAGLDVAQTWSAAQNFNSSDLVLNGATSGTLIINAAATAGSNTITLPAGTTDFSATGGTSKVVKQTSAGGAFTVAQVDPGDISSTSGTGAVVRTTGPTIGVLNLTGQLLSNVINGKNIAIWTASTGTNPCYNTLNNTGGNMFVGRDNSAGTDPGAGVAYAGCIWMESNHRITLGTNNTARGYLDNDGGLVIGSPTGSSKGAGSINATTMYINGTQIVSVTGTYQASPSNPTGTADTTGKMMGLAGTITPATTGKILVIISGDISNGTILDGGKVQIRMGTGTAPANGDALTGTAYGGLVRSNTAVAGEFLPFSLNAIVSGLTLSTAYWIDVGLAAITGGTASVADISISAIEL